MRSSAVITAFAIAAAMSLLAAPADAAAKKRKPQYVYGRGHTLFVSRDEDGRKRTRIIVQKRSYLDPGTEVLQGERNYTDYAILPNQSPTSVLNNTTFGDRGGSVLPRPFESTTKGSLFGW